AGWDLTGLSCDDANSTESLGTRTATVNLEAGETVTCTFTNTKRGTIIVEKQTSPDGALGSFTFTGDAAGTISDNGTIVVSNLVPGTYTSTENDPTPNFDLGAIVCDDGTSTTPSTWNVGTRTATFKLDPGETVTCTFTNVQRGTITIIKNTVPDGPQDFHFNTTGSGLSGFDLDDDDNATLSNTKTFENVVAGDYSVTEVAVPGWDLTGIQCVTAGGSSATTEGATAGITMVPGGSVTCTYTNVERGSVTIVKDARPNDAQDFAFSGGLGAFSLDDDATATLPSQMTFGNLVPGSYAVTEGATAGWDLTNLVCNDTDGGTTIQGATATIDLDPGQHITCTFENSKPSIQIVKTAGTAADGAEFVTEPGNVTYTYKVTNTGPITLLNVTVRDDNGTPAVTGDDFSATCPKTTLAAGEEMTCTATVAVSSSRTNIARATGESEQGTDVEDTDDAVVRVPDTGIDKTNNDADGVVGHGQEVTYTILVEVVQGPVTNAVVTDTLPVGQTYVSGSQTSNPAAATFNVSGDGRTLTWTYASLPSGDPALTITYKVTIDANAPTGNQTNVAQICVSELEDCKTDTTTVRVPLLTIVKSFVGNTGGTAPDGSPEAKIGDVLTYTLAYDLTNGPVTNGVITDTLPVGLAYVAGTATNNAEFTFQSFNAATRTLTWTAPTVTADGSVTYKATVLAGSDELPQPLVNVATIDSNETDKDDDTKKVFVEPPPLAETATPTLPPTDSLYTGSQGSSNPGFSLMLLLLALGGFALVTGFITPVPERVRRRGRLG
ncbi:MAG TPA: hypothetical protein VFR14_01915, partial [Candidatus Limnocylindrales bacterium]|nr:hypothetical protein [Candidatus Limnocylindrales bacterium]